VANKRLHNVSQRKLGRIL